MKVTTSQLKSLIKESIEEVMKEQVKGIDIKGHKNLTIKSGHSFDDLPEWFQKAKTENAIVSINSDKELVWHKGTWHTGTWIGVWEDGTWINGIWYNGVWENGIWKNGDWFAGTWKSGTWIDGEWFKGRWLDKNNPHPNKR